MRSRFLVLLITAAFLATAAGAGAAAMPTLVPATWSMRSTLDGHLTRFTLRLLHRWGCWTGRLLDLRDVKGSPSDYWAPGADMIGDQILYHDRDGSWRMVGTYTESRDPANVWTMQIHAYPGRATPYVIMPGRPIDSDTRTQYYTDFVRGVDASRCLHGDVAAWGEHVYWRSRFRFGHGGVLRAHYE